MFSRNILSIVGRRLIRKEINVTRPGYFNKIPIFRTYQLSSTVGAIQEPNEAQLTHKVHTPLKEVENNGSKTETPDETNKITNHPLMRELALVIKNKRLGNNVSDDTVKKIRDEIPGYLEHVMSKDEVTMESDKGVIDCCQFLLAWDTPVAHMKELQNYLLSRKDSLSFSNLTYLMTLCLNYPEFGELFNTKDAIMGLWDSCHSSKPQDILFVLNLIGKSDMGKRPSVPAKIEKSVSYMGQGDIVALLHICSKYRMRMYVTLKELVEKLTDDGLMMMKMIDYSSLLFSFSSLSFYPVEAISKICKCIVIKTKMDATKVEKKILLSVIRSLAALRYKNHDILNNFSQLLFEDLESVNSTIDFEIFTRVLQSLALFSYIPESLKCDSLVSFAKKSYENGIWEESPMLWLNMVWSMAVLNIADETIIGSVLNDKFYSCLEAKSDSTPFLVKRIQELKLLAVDCTAALDIDNYTGPRLSKTKDNSLMYQQVKSNSKRMILDLMFVTNKLAENKDKCYKINKFLPECGYILDVELLVDSDCKLLPVEEDQQGDGNKKKHKVAVIVLPFDGLTINEPQEILGRFVVQFRHLKKMGYKIAEIRHDQWPSKNSTVDTKTEFLKMKILEAIEDS